MLAFTQGQLETEAPKLNLEDDGIDAKSCGMPKIKRIKPTSRFKMTALAGVAYIYIYLQQNMYTIYKTKTAKS